MNKLFYLSIFGFMVIITGCTTGGNGELTGVLNRPTWYQIDPYGMNYIPAGSYNMGPNDHDVSFAHSNRTKTVSIPAFFMDITEISNNEYRQFVYYVRDSIAYRMLAEEDPEAWLNKTYDDEFEERDESEWHINWEERFEWRSEEQGPILSQMYIPDGTQRFYGHREIDPKRLMYDYYWIDYKEAAYKGRVKIERLYNSQAGTDQVGTDHPTHRKPKENDELPFPHDPGIQRGRDQDMGWRNSKGQNNAMRGHSDRSRFLIHEVINVYPDTLVWVHDFTYAYNDPLTKAYFAHPAYDEYPVVGITWQQANAFNVWRTNYMNNFREARGLAYVQDFRLPTEAEWEYAARGGLDVNRFPWGGPYIRNAKGCFLGNFKPMRGRYMEDGGMYTVKVTSYHPNDYGLYCMAGNVAEWTSTAYDESVYEHTWDLSPEYRYNALDHDPPSLKRKVTRGGSWKDLGYFLENGTRSYEYQDTAKSYIGFRSVMSYLGRGGTLDAEDI